MSSNDHIEKAEELLQAAKDVARRTKETVEDRKADQAIVMDLLDFARTHAAIAAAQRTGVER